VNGALANAAGDRDQGWSWEASRRRTASSAACAAAKASAPGSESRPLARAGLPHGRTAKSRFDVIVHGRRVDAQLNRGVGHTPFSAQGREADRERGRITTDRPSICPRTAGSWIEPFAPWGREVEVRAPRDGEGEPGAHGTHL